MRLIGDIGDRPGGESRPSAVGQTCVKWQVSRPLVLTKRVQHVRPRISREGTRIRHNLLEFNLNVSFLCLRLSFYPLEM